MIISSFRCEPTVTNGWAYEKARFDASLYDALVVPQNTEVRDRPNSNLIEIFVEKGLVLAGHPRATVDIHEERKLMGVASKAEGRVLTIAAYGEWDSHIEGGTAMRLLVVAPKALVISRTSRPLWEGRINAPRVPAESLRFPPSWQKVDTEVDLNLTLSGRLPNKALNRTVSRKW